MKFFIKYKKALKHLIFLFLFLSSLLLVKNNLQYNITETHVDEIHTLNFGLSSLYSGEVTNLRVGESTRCLARVIYPAALYYMSSNMIKGQGKFGYWNNYYIKWHYKNPKSIIADPDLQDFTFAMKFFLAALVLLSFLLASYKLSNTFGFLAGITYFFLAFNSSLVLDMLSIFYTESSLIIAFNLIVVLALTKKVNVWVLYVCSAFLLAFAISTKLTGIIFIIPIIVLILQKDSLFKKMKIEGFIILILFFLALINMYASSYMELLDQTIANVYHYKTGHKVTQPSGIYQLSKIIETISPWIFIFPVALIVLVYKKSKELPFLLSISVVSLIIIIASIDVHFFLVRNLTTPLVIMMLIMSVCFCHLMNLIKFKPQIILTGSILCILLIQVYSVNNKLLHVDSSTIKNYTEGSQNIATIDVEEELVLDAHSVLESMPDPLTLVSDVDKLREQFLPYDCVVVKRVKHNKYYTNYILPLDYRLEARHGDYCVYKRAL